MHNQTLQLSLIKESIEEVFSEAQPSYQKSFLRIASLFAEFTIQDINSNLKKISQKELSDDELTTLIQLSSGCKKATEAKQSYILTDQARKEIYAGFDSVDALRALLSMVEFNHPSVKQQMLTGYLKGEVPALSEQSMDQLVASHQVISWIEDIIQNLPSIEDINRSIKSKERIEPFYQITKYFAGRTHELKILSDFVEWIPENTLIEKLKVLLKDTFNWSIKPPLLVTGIGGIGKSTLIAKFIIDHLYYKDKGVLPFIYFDFDKPGLSLANNMLLLADGLRQLKVQFPEYTKDFDKVIDQIRLEYLSANNFQNSSRKTDRNRFIQEYIEQYNLKTIEIPVLIVFDSFEEIQNRASAVEIHDFFSFLKQLNQFIPKLRCVFAGRAEVVFEDLKFESIELTSFDRKAATGFLSSFGLTKDLGEKVYDRFGGNPLTLMLAANVLLNENFAKEKLDSVKVGNFFNKIDESRIQEQLVKRNLEHIHDESVKKIAIPGILVRLINPDIIQKVLAKPCGLGEISVTEATTLFKQLLKESFLIQQDGNDIYFRQDLRISLRDLIEKEDPVKAKSIHEAAIAYYGNFKDVISRSECIYHRLMRGDDTQEIEPHFDVSMRPFLERSLVELSEQARLTISPLLNIKVKKQTLDRAELGQWEGYMINDIRNAFLKGDERTLQVLCKKLKSRNNRFSSPEMLYYEAKIYIRLNDFKMASNLLGRYLNQTSNFEIQQSHSLSSFGIPLLKAKMAEYQFDFKAAMSQIEKVMITMNINTLSQLINQADEYNSIVNDTIITYKRLRKRNFSDALNARIIYDKFNVLGTRSNTPKIYQAYFRNLRNFNIHSEDRTSLDSLCWNLQDFSEGLKLLKSRIANIEELERFIYTNWRIGLKDISEPGHFEIVCQDALMFIELNQSYEDFENRNYYS